MGTPPPQLKDLRSPRLGGYTVLVAMEMPRSNLTSQVYSEKVVGQFTGVHVSIIYVSPKAVPGMCQGFNPYSFIAIPPSLYTHFLPPAPFPHPMHFLLILPPSLSFCVG